MRTRLTAMATTLTALLVLGACSSGGDASPTTTTAAATTTATQSGPSTTATTAAAATTTTVPSSAPTSTATPAPPAATTATLAAYLELLGLRLEAAEAACVAGELDAASVASLAAANAGGEPTREASVDVYAGLLTCTPASFVNAQIDAVTSNTEATPDQARCVVEATNARIAGDPALLELAAGEPDTAAWPAAQQEQLRQAIAGCAPASLIDVILRGSGD